MTLSGDRAAQASFERGFVAARYLLGHRGESTWSGLGCAGFEARKLALALELPNKRERALVLAAAWGQVSAELERRSFREEPRG